MVKESLIDTLQRMLDDSQAEAQARSTFRRRLQSSLSACSCSYVPVKRYMQVKYCRALDAGEKAMVGAALRRVSQGDPAPHAVNHVMRSMRHCCC